MDISINKKAVIYCRVSTKEQVEEGNSLSTQEKICKEYAIKNGYDIAEVFIEQGESAKTAHRTELQKLLSYCAMKRNEVKAVITYKIDRISRNTDDYSQIRILLKRYGVEIKSTSEYFENSPAGRFMENIIANVAQFDNDVRTERSMSGMRDAVREGRYVWLPPAGYNNARVDGKCTIVQNQLAPLIRRTFEEIAKNLYSVDQVRRMMNKEGLTTNQGKPISKANFYRLIKNEIYTGWTKKFGERHKCLFEPIISDELFAKVQRVLNHRKHRGFDYQRENPDFPLRRFVFHPTGKKLTGSWSKGRTKKYPYYRYSIPGFEIKKLDIENYYTSFLENFEFTAQNYDKFRVQIQENLFKKTEDRQKEAKKLNAYIEELKAKQSLMIQKNFQGILSDEVLKQQSLLIEKQMQYTQNSLQEIPNTKEDIKEAWEYASHYLRKPGEIWKKAPFHIKLMLQWFQFPQGIIFDGERIGTKEISCLFNVKEGLLSIMSQEGYFSINIKNHIPKKPVIPVLTVARNVKTNSVLNKKDLLLYWNRIESDLLKLGGIMKTYNAGTEKNSCTIS